MPNPQAPSGEKVTVRGTAVDLNPSAPSRGCTFYAEDIEIGIKKVLISGR